LSADLLEAGLAGEPPKTRVPVTLERAVAAFAMAGICVITFANVVVRYFTNVSFAFTEEYSIFLMVVMTMCGSAVAVAADRHIRITFAVERLRPGARAFAATLAWTASLVMFALLVWLGTRLAYDEWRFEVTSPGLGVAQWLYTVWLPILGAVVLLRIVGRLIRAFRDGA
jgi:TRAP-type C4-dicarboxylate transport system permease small subunit